MYNVHCMWPSWVVYLALHHPQPSPQAWIHHGPWNRLKGRVRSRIWIFVMGFDLMLPWHHQSTVFRHGRWRHSWPEWSTVSLILQCLEYFNLISAVLWYVWFLASAKQYIKAISSQRYTVLSIQKFGSAPRLPTFAEATGLGPDEIYTYHIITYPTYIFIPQIFPENQSWSLKKTAIPYNSPTNLLITSISSIKSSSYQISWVSRLQGSPHQDATLQSHEQMCRSWQFWKYRNVKHVKTVHECEW